MCLSKAILETINELVHLELLTDSEFAANVNFSSLRNLASNELFFTSFISLQQFLLIYKKILKKYFSKLKIYYIMITQSIL